MSKRTVLIFAYHFPPDPEIGGARPYRFYKYLTRLGYACKIITAYPQATTQNPDITYIPNPFTVSPRRGIRWQLERAVRWSILPSIDGLGWSIDAYHAARNLVRRLSGSPITIFSTFPPLGVHLAAWRLARAEGLPWIADFRDPLAWPWLSRWSGFRGGLRRWIEQSVIRRADVVIANTDAMQQRWQRQYPDQASNIRLLWNGFDPEKRISAKPLPDRKHKVLCHAGSLYAGRTVGPLLASIDRLMNAGSLSADQLRLRLLGEIEPGNLGSSEVAARGQAKGWLELTARAVPQAEASEIMRTSDFLLLVQPHTAELVPAKLFEYVQIGRPILAFVPKNSVVERILGQSGIPYRCIYVDDAPARMDEAIAEFVRLAPEVARASAWFEQTFNGEAQIETLVSVVEKASQDKGR